MLAAIGRNGGSDKIASGSRLDGQLEPLLERSGLDLGDEFSDSTSLGRRLQLVPMPPANDSRQRSGIQAG
jgi:hypothetical protein